MRRIIATRFSSARAATEVVEEVVGVGPPVPAFLFEVGELLLFTMLSYTFDLFLLLAVELGDPVGVELAVLTAGSCGVEVVAAGDHRCWAAGFAGGGGEERRNMLCIVFSISSLWPSRTRRLLSQQTEIQMKIHKSLLMLVGVAAAVRSSYVADLLHMMKMTMMMCCCETSQIGWNTHSDSVAFAKDSNT